MFDGPGGIAIRLRRSNRPPGVAADKQEGTVRI